MLKYIRLMVLVFIFTGCVPSTLNPIVPELDSPIVFGDVTPAPWGCVMWRNSEVECCPEHWEELPDC